MNGKSFTVAYFPHIPFTISDANGTRGGIAMQLLGVLQDKYRFKLNFTREQVLAELYDNGTVGGVLGKVSS